MSESYKILELGMFLEVTWINPWTHFCCILFIQSFSKYLLKYHLPSAVLE